MFAKFGSFAKGAIDEDINPMPDIKIENPSKNVPIGFLREILLFVLISIITPTNANIGVNDSGFNIRKKKFVLWMPDKLKIHDVTVVPTFEPIIIATVCDNFIMPEFTKPTSITVTADEL